MIVLYDDAQARTFEPFATSRPLGEVRAGALLGRERWAMWFGQAIDAFASSSHLAEFTEFDAPPFLSAHCPAGTWIVNSRALPLPQHPARAAQADGAALRDVDVVRLHGRVAAVRLRDALDAADARALSSGSLTLDSLVYETASDLAVEGVWLNAPWDIVRHLGTMLAGDIAVLSNGLSARRVTPSPEFAQVHLVGTHAVWVEEGATIEPFTVFDTTAGPVLVRVGATVQSFTRIIGPCYIGPHSTVVGDRIASSSIGEHCRVHGELSTTVFIGYANKGHDGFVGHSIVGRWVNLGAGTITSNLKNTYGSVAMWSTDGVRDTGLQFAGTFFGDHVKTGIGVRLTTGCVLGAGTNVFDAMPPKALAPFSWGAHAPYAVFEADKFEETATRMMQRRAVSFDDAQRRHWQSVRAYALADSRWPTR